MEKQLKKLLCAALSLSMVAGSIVLPTAYAEGEAVDLKSWKFDFGATAPTDDSWTQVTSEMAFTDERGYGFLGQSAETFDLPGVVDGYNQSADDKTNLADGGTGTDAYSDYVYTEDVNMPIRFSVAVDKNTYYKVKVTMGNSDKDSKIYLTSERRHFVLMEETIKAGEKLEKEFTVAVHNVKWKNRSTNPTTQPVYEDDKLNICVYGENAMINAVEIQQIAKPKVVWAFGDSTVTDGATSTPWFGYNTYAGWAIAIAKYLPSDVAVVNLGEGGLSTKDQSYFDVGKNDITAGDIVAFQMGHNDSSTESYTANLDYYYNATTSKGGTFVLCSPIERLSQYSTEAYHNAALAYATAKNTPFVPLHTLTDQMYSELGSVKQWYTHSCMWKGTASKPVAEQDVTHLNDFGADMTTSMFFETLAELSATNSALAPYVTAQADVEPMVLSETIMKGGTDSYVSAPNDLFPYPEASIDYANMVDVTSSATKVVDGVTYLDSYKTVRHSDLSYITAFAAVYDADGVLTAVRQNRLEPMSAKTVETVSLVTEDTPNGLAIPEGGTYKTFVWEGAFSDGTMTYAPYSEAFSGYKYLSENVETRAWVGATETDGAVTVTAEGVSKAITTPVTAGKVMTQFVLTPKSGTNEIVLSPAADGSADNGVKLSINSTTGAVSMGEEIVIDSVKAGTEQLFTLIYDIDYGKLRINIENVGIVDVDIPDAITVNGINPSQIASVGFTGDAVVKDLSVSTLKTDALPEKTLTIEYDNTMGTVTAPASAVKNSKVTIAAQANPTDEHNYVFGGWYNEDGTTFSSDAQTSFYLVDDMKLSANFYEQLGITGVKDYNITADKPVVKISAETAETVTLDIADCVDEYGNPVADFEHNSENVQWALKTEAEGIALNGNTLSIAADTEIGIEEIKKVVVSATCNNVTKEYTVLVHNCTNIIYNEDFESGVAGEVPADWKSENEGRYTVLYAADGDNIYVDMAPVGNGNNGATLTGSVFDKAVDGIVMVEADIVMSQPTGSEPNRRMIIGLADASGKYAIELSRYQSQDDYKINGVDVPTHPSNSDWATLTTVMNYATKTADIKLTSLDGKTTYFEQANVSFANSAAEGFQKIVYETNRYSSAAKVDNIIVNHIAASAEVPAITAAPANVEITNLTQPTTVNVTVPEGWSMTAATSADEQVITVKMEDDSIAITPVGEGDTEVTVLAVNDANPYLKSIVKVPVSVKKMDNANLSALSIKTNTGSELMDGFDMAVAEYNAKAEKTVTALTVAASTDHSAATYAIEYNDTAVEGGTVTLDTSAGSHVVEVTVTAPDTTTTKTYTVNIDNTYVLAENFNVAPASSWGVTGPGGLSTENGMLKLLVNAGTNLLGEQEKVFSSDITTMTSVHLTFDWQSLVEVNKGRHSNFVLKDSSDNLILLLRGVGNSGLLYSTTSADNNEYKKFTNFSQNWYTVDLTLDFTAKTINGTITEKTSETVAHTFTDEPMANSAANLGKFYATNTFSAAPMGIDNFYIK